MTFCQRSVLHIFLGVRECSQSITQSPVHSLTFQRLHDMLTPAALQRSELDPSAHCPVAPPYSVESGDESGWPLRMVLPRRRSTEHHSHPTASAVHLAPSPCFLAAEITGVGEVERAHHRLHTQKNIYTHDPLAPTRDTSSSGQDSILLWGLMFVILFSLRTFKILCLKHVN